MTIKRTLMVRLVPSVLARRIIRLKNNKNIVPEFWWMLQGIRPEGVYQVLDVYIKYSGGQYAKFTAMTQNAEEQYIKMIWVFNPNVCDGLPIPNPNPIPNPKAPPLG